MNEREFCFWLQGIMEVGDPKVLDERQIQTIKDHLNLVFNKVTPSRGDVDVKIDGKKVLEDFQLDMQAVCSKAEIAPYDPRTRKLCAGLKPALNEDGYVKIEMDLDRQEFYDLYSKEKICKYWDGPIASC